MVGHSFSQGCLPEVSLPRPIKEYITSEDGIIFCVERYAENSDVLIHVLDKDYVEIKDVEIRDHTLLIRNSIEIEIDDILYTHKKNFH